MASWTIKLFVIILVSTRPMQLDRNAFSKLADYSTPADNETSRSRFTRCTETGILRHALHGDWGGFDDSFADLCLSHERMGQASRDCGLVLSINAHLWGAVFPILDFGSTAQKREFIPGLISGRLIGGHAITEPEAGSDIQAMSTEALPISDGYELHGHKRYITNAPIADLLVVYARTKTGISAFIIRKEDSGVELTNEPVVASCHSATMGDVVLQKCHIPADRLLGRIGAGTSLIQHALELERGFIFAAILGIMEWQLATTIAHARDRTVGGFPLGRNQAVSHRIADMKVRVDSARLWINHCAQLRDSGKRITLASAQTKLYISEAFLQSSLDAVQTLGASGLVKGNLLAQLVHDAMASRLFSGSSEIQKNIIAALLGTGDGYKRRSS